MVRMTVSPSWRDGEVPWPGETSRGPPGLPARSTRGRSAVRTAVPRSGMGSFYTREVRLRSVGGRQHSFPGGDCCRRRRTLWPSGGSGGACRASGAKCAAPDVVDPGIMSRFDGSLPASPAKCPHSTQLPEMWSAHRRAGVRAMWGGGLLGTETRQVVAS